MLILADGEDVTDAVPTDPRIWLVESSESSRPGTLGEKRNLACSLMNTEIIVVFDDDDWQSPDRIEQQVNRLLTTDKAVTGYHSVRFTNGSEWWKYFGTPDLAIGMSLCFRRSWWESNRFPHSQIGQDEEFARDAYHSGRMISVDAGEEMIGTIHPKNTSPRRTFENPWQRIASPGDLPPGFRIP